MIAEVLSRVEASCQNYRDVCYEWEEAVAAYFNVPIRQVLALDKLSQNAAQNTLKELVKKILLAIPHAKEASKIFYGPVLSQDINQPLTLCFIMFVREIPICSGNNCVPVFIDIWSPMALDKVIRCTRKLKIFYVTSRDIYNRIKTLSPSSNVYYMPLSIADKYHSENFALYRNKTIDVLHSSRINPILHEYMLRYIASHSNIEYVYKQNGEYFSTTRGNLGIMGSRVDYMNLLASAKVSLLGCSGIDNSREGTFEICYPTPRFYESAISGCALIGRYPENQEFTELNMKRYCPNITSYEQFVNELERALAISPEELYAQNRDFIINSLTSKRAEQIKRDLEALTCRNS